MFPRSSFACSAQSSGRRRTCRSQVKWQKETRWSTTCESNMRVLHGALRHGVLGLVTKSSGYKRLRPHGSWQGFKATCTGCLGAEPFPSSSCQTARPCCPGTQAVLLSSVRRLSWRKSCNLVLHYKQACHVDTCGLPVVTPQPRGRPFIANSWRAHSRSRVP